MTNPPAGTNGQRLVLVVPGRLETRTGGYGYDRRLADGLRALGWDVQVRELDDSFPHPTSDALARASRVFDRMARGTRVIVDGLAFGAMPEIVERHAAALRLVALVHHPLAYETGLDAATAAALARRERRALAVARLVVVTSRATRLLLRSYGVDPSRIVIVEPGTDVAPPAVTTGSPPLRLLTVAAVVPRKGHETLMRALATLSGRDWRLTCVGSLARHPATAARVKHLVESSGLASRVALAGEVDDRSLSEHYARSDLFVLPTFHEGYGMAVAEALARGVPVIATDTGAIADLVGGDAGLLVPPGDADALASALARVMDEPRLLARLTAGARRARERLPRWADAARQMAGALLAID